MQTAHVISTKKDRCLLYTSVTSVLVQMTVKTVPEHERLGRRGHLLCRPSQGVSGSLALCRVTAVRLRVWGFEGRCLVDSRLQTQQRRSVSIQRLDRRKAEEKFQDRPKRNVQKRISAESEQLYTLLRVHLWNILMGKYNSQHLSGSK